MSRFLEQFLVQDAGSFWVKRRDRDRERAHYSLFFF
jgi:hypothetical protein